MSVLTRLNNDLWSSRLCRRLIGIEGDA